ncbi:hypothetical protein TWF281_006093 [Arthrobotrys megalospora]
MYGFDDARPGVFPEEISDSHVSECRNNNFCVASRKYHRVKRLFRLGLTQLASSRGHHEEHHKISNSRIFIILSKMNPSGHESFEAGSSANNHGGRPKLEHLQSHFSHIAPHLKAHLTDRQANPILSTSEPASGYLAPLSEAFVNAYETGSRMGLGMPVRVTLSTTESSLVVLQSAPTSGQPELPVDQKARQPPVSPMLTAENGPDTSKMLVSTVIAPSGELAEARVAIWAIEDVARRLQTSLEK